MRTPIVVADASHAAPCAAAAVPHSIARGPAAGTRGVEGAVTGSVRRVLRAEGLAVLAAAATLYAATGRGWAFFALLFLAPDASFLAYLAGARVGAAVYNALHSYVGPLALALLAQAPRGHAPHADVAGAPALLPVALVWAAHIGLDRLLGYGLKYPGGFGDTHLGSARGGA